MLMEERDAGPRRLIRLSRAAMASMALLAIFAMTAPGVVANGSAPEITIHAVRYDFKPAEITLKTGQTVRLIFVADDVPHGISIDGLGIDADLPKHKPQTVTITPSSVGDFEGECSRYCGVGHRDMTFVVHVIP